MNQLSHLLTSGVNFAEVSTSAVNVNKSLPDRTGSEPPGQDRDADIRAAADTDAVIAPYIHPPHCQPIL